MTAERFPYLWAWRHRKVGPPTRKVPWFGDGVDRAGQSCRVIARGGMNTAWLEFEDGWQVVTSRGGIRRAASSQAAQSNSSSGSPHTT